jgi:hypothetical protein
MGPERTFDRLVDIEARFISCRAAADESLQHIAPASWKGITEAQRQSIFSDFRICAQGVPRKTCNAQIDAARNAQIFFNRYYRGQQPYSSDAQLMLWARGCKRLGNLKGFNLKTVDIRDACRRSVLLIPMAQLLYPTNHINGPFVSLGWQYFERAATTCGEMNLTLLEFYGRRCRGIGLVRDADSGIRSNYNTGAVRDYYDEVDWDLCRIMAKGNLRDSIDGYEVMDSGLGRVD